MIKAESYFGLTDQGLQRQNNEDAFVLQPMSDSLLLACVIDGVGGYEGGEVAGNLAQSTLVNRSKDSFADPLPKLHEIFLEVNEEILKARLANQNLSGMACVATAIVVDFKMNIFYYIHVGDTRLYLFRDSSLIKVTKDQSFVGYLEDNHKITESEAMQHPKRNEINKALGFETNLSNLPDYFEKGSSPFLPDDLLLLCSDGLTDLVTSREISRAIEDANTLQLAAEKLINQANDAGGKDNITAVLVENTNARTRSKRTKPVNPVIETPQPEEQPARIVTITRKPLGLIVFLLLTVIAMACTIAYMWNEKRIEPAPQVSIPDPENPDQRKIVDSLAVSPFVFLDSSGRKIITITKPIFIAKDSVYLNANGIRFVCDSSLEGAAFIVDEKCNDFVLENCVIDGFETGILNTSKSLRLRNVHFENCKTSVQQGLNLGKSSDLSFDITDSSIKKLKSASRQRQ